MMTELHAVGRFGCLCMKKVSKYIIEVDPVFEETWQAAKLFFSEFAGNVKFYKKIRMLSACESDEEADKMVLWWENEMFYYYPHSLGVLMECNEKIEELVGNYNVLDAFSQLKTRLIFSYRILKEKGMIDE